MSSRSTWVWFTVAVGLFVFIFFFERHWGNSPVGEAAVPDRLLPELRPGLVSSLQVRNGKEFVHIDHEGEAWKLTAPIAYPAHRVLIENLLQALARLDYRAPIATGTLADFGLAEPAAIIVIQQGKTRMELQLGAKTPVANLAYARVVGLAGVFTVDANLFDALPKNVNDWRSRGLLATAKTMSFDRLEARSATKGLGFSLQCNATNGTWRLIKPMQARADRLKVGQLLLKGLESIVTDFVTDNPRADLEAYGLQNPGVELVLGLGTNDLMTVQFGGSPSNNPAVVYARRLSHTNIVTVPRELPDLLNVSYADFRDRHLFTFAPDVVSQIEVRGPASFVLRRQDTNQWRVVEPLDMPADLMLVKELLAELYAFKVAGFEKDVVTDFAAYGLAKPLWQYWVKSAGTNAQGPASFVLSQANVSTNNTGHYFANRPDEDSVYAVREEDVMRLPTAGWQLRDRRIWDFAVSNVTSVTLSQQGRTNQLVRKGTNDWAFAPGSQGMLNEYAVEEIVFRLGQLRANAWRGMGPRVRADYGFAPDGYRVEIEVKENDKPRVYTVDFGRMGQAQVPLACVTLEGQPWVFEFPWQLYQMMNRDLTLPRLAVKPAL